MPIIWKMQLPFRDRVSLVFLFGLGAIACGAGIVRMVLQQQVEQQMSVDPTWTGWPFYIAVDFEINVGIVRQARLIFAQPSSCWFPWQYVLLTGFCSSVLVHLQFARSLPPTSILALRDGGTHSCRRSDHRSQVHKGMRKLAQQRITLRASCTRLSQQKSSEVFLEVFSPRPSLMLTLEWLGEVGYI